MHSHRRFVHKIVKDAKYYLTAGNQCYINGKPGEAIFHYNKVLELEKNNIDAHYYLGICLFKEGQVYPAMKELSAVLDLNPEHAKAYMRLAEIMLYKNKYGFVISYASAAIKFDSKHELGDLAYRVLALGQYRLGNKENAVANYNKAIQLNPNETENFIHRGELFYNEKQFDAALSDFAIAYQLNATCKIDTTILCNCLSQCTDFFNLSRQSIFDLIKVLPDKQQQIFLLKQCLLEGNPLGNRMWDVEFPGEGCNVKTGILKDIYSYLREISPEYTLPDQRPSVTTNSIFVKPVIRKVDDVDEYLKQQNCVMADVYYRGL